MVHGISRRCAPFLILVGIVSTSRAQETIRLPVSAASTQATFHQYFYAAASKVIRYFVVKAGTNGAVKTAFDACEVCYPANKGYRQSVDQMVCNNCGQRFLIAQLGAANLGGGCWPGHLPSSIANDSVIIAKAAIETGARFFPVSSAVTSPQRSPGTANSGLLSISIQGRDLIFNFSQDLTETSLALHRADGSLILCAGRANAQSKTLRVSLGRSNLPAGTYLYSISNPHLGSAMHRGRFTIE